MPRPTLLLATLLALPTLSLAQPPARDGALSVTATPQSTKAHPGDTIALALTLTYKPGWHSWPNKPMLPGDLKDLDAIPTEIHPDPDHTSPSLTLRPDAAQWPAPSSVSGAAFTGTPIQIQAYTGAPVVYVPITIAPNATSGPATIALSVYYQACNDSSCDQPTDAAAQTTIDIIPAADPIPAPSDSTTKLFANLKPFDLSAPASPAPAPAASPKSTPAASSTAAAPPARTLLGITIGSSLIILFLCAALGGAILNLTPCVLPVIPLKIMSLVQHAGSPRRRITLGLYMAAGVVFFWFVIGIPMMILRSFDPSQFIFGTWWVTLSLALLIALMGLGIMGLFTISLPQSVYMVDTKADSPAGSFLFGIMTAVLGLPCFGFVAGGLLAGAASLPRASIAAIFLGLGVGMAAPYLLLAIKPALINKLPRTGPASELVKQVLGLLLLAAAAFFAAAGIKTLLADKPYLKESIAWWAVAFFVTLAALWLIIRTFRISKKAAPRIIAPILAVLAVATIVVFANGLARPDSKWLPYSPSQFQQDQAAGKVIVADFTADWCINCKVLKGTVLDAPSVRKRTAQRDVSLTEVDLTSRSAPGWAFLSSIGRTNVPTLAIYGPGLPPDQPIIFNAYTPDMVLSAIEQAKAPKVANTTKP